MSGLIPILPNAEGTRAESPSESRAMLKKYLDHEQGTQSGRAATRAECQKQYDMMPPRDVAKMARESKRHLPNADWGEHRRMVDESVTPVFRIRHNVKRPVNVELRMSAEADHTRRNQLERRIAEGYGRMLRMWRGRKPHDELASKWMVMFGLGPVYFPWKWSWQYRALHPKDVILPDGAKVDPAEWNWFAVADEITIFDLAAALDDEESAEEIGWNAPAIRALLAHRKKTDESAGEGDSGDNLEERAAAIKRRDLYETYEKGQRDALKVFHFYVREADGKVSQFMLLREAVGVEAVDKAYLFEDLRAYDDFEDVLVPMSLDSGEGTWHSVRGLSVRIHKFCAASNDFKNNAIATTRMLSGLVLQPGSGSDLKRVQEIQLDSPVTLIPPGFNAINQGLPNNAGGLVEMDNILRELRDRNVAGFGVGVPDASNDRPVGTARLDFARSSELKEADRENLYGWLERLHASVLKRIQMVLFDEDSPVSGKPEDDEVSRRDRLSPGYANLHTNFLEWLEERYRIDRKLLKEIRPENTTSRRQLGDGNPAVLEARMQQLAPLKAELSGVAVTAFNRHIMDSVVGPDQADEFFPEAIPAEEIDQRHEASLEHAAFAQAVYIPVASTDNHLVHVETHLSWAEQTLQGYLNGAVGKQEAFTRARAVEVHVTGQEDGGHLGRLRGSEAMAPVVEAFDQRLGAIQKLTNQIGQEIKAEAEAARKQQEELAAVPAKTAREQVMLQESETRRQIQQLESQVDALAKLEKARGQNETKTQQAEQKAALDELKVRLNHEVDLLKAQMKHNAETRNAEQRDPNAGA